MITIMEGNKDIYTEEDGQRENEDAYNACRAERQTEEEEDKAYIVEDI